MAGVGIHHFLLFFLTVLITLVGNVKSFEEDELGVIFSGKDQPRKALKQGGDDYDEEADEEEEAAPPPPTLILVASLGERLAEIADTYTHERNETESSPRNRTGAASASGGSSISTLPSYLRNRGQQLITFLGNALATRVQARYSPSIPTTSTRKPSRRRRVTSSTRKSIVVK